MVGLVAPWSPNGPDSSVCWDVSLPPMTEWGHVGSPCESVAFSVSLVIALVHLGTIYSLNAKSVFFSEYDLRHTFNAPYDP